MDENQYQNQPNNPQNKSQLKVLWDFIFDLVKIAAIALIIIIPFRIFIAQPFVVSGSSMKPNFHDHDYLIIDQFSYRFSPPQRGDVIVLHYPKDPSQYFIKRIIGLPGEQVKFSQGHAVIINKDHPEGIVLNEPYLESPTETIGRPEPQPLGSGEYFVLGDNRTASSDSRVWGILPENDIVGKVWLRVFPFNVFGFFSHPVYQ